MIILNLASVAIGGALGSVCRYLTFELINNLTGNFNNALGTTLGTILVNIAGSFLVGAIYFISIINKSGLILPEIRLLIITGFLGGFTTFSAFSLDVLKFINNGEINIALFYIATSVFLSLIAVFAGFYLAQFVSLR